jgi:type I restriction enzyme S subunit
MAGDWKETTIGEHIELATGNAFQSARFGLTPDSGTLLARGDNVKEGEFEWGEKARYWPTLTPDLERYLLQEGDVLLGMDGSKVGKNWVRVRNRDLPCLLVQRVARLRAKPTMDQGFLRYIIGNPQFRDYVARVRTGTSIPHISGGQIRSYEIFLPPLAEQKAIAAVLGALDDKIELNRRMNATLEAMARALFKSWFVDFDPSRAKIDGRKPEGLDDATAALFPDHLEDSPLGHIPKGWRACPLAELIEVVKGRSYRSEELSESKTALVTLKSFLRGGGYRTDGLKPFTGEYKPNQLVRPGDLVVAFTDVTQAADVIGRPALVRSDDRFETLVASLDVGIVRPKSKLISIPFLYCLFLTAEFQAHTYSHATGTTVLHLGSTAIPSFVAVLPPAEIVEKFSERARPIFHLIDENAKQSRTLATLRDSLLPKLLNGDLSVDKIKEGLVA